MRKPDVYNQFVKVLQKRVEQQRGSGNLLLPGERDLAAEYEISRKTLRKALQYLEEKGIVYRESKATKIYPARKQRGKYAFVAMSNHIGKSFLFPVYKRLWQKLSDSARLSGIAIDLVLLSEDTQEQEKQIQQLDEYDMVFKSQFTVDANTRICDAGLPLISVDASTDREDIPSVTLDNYSVGEAAAVALANAGCRKVSVMQPRRTGFLPYQQRIAGFTEAIKKLDKEVTQIDGGKAFDDVLDYINWGCNKLDEIPGQGFDGIFFVMDEWIEIFTWRLFMRHEIPDPLRVIAFDSSGTARSCAGNLTTVSNGNSSLAVEIMDCINDFEDRGLFPELFRRSVKSEVQEGDSV